MNKREIVCYNFDGSGIEGKAEKVFFPKTPEDVQSIIRSGNFDVVPRGSGTGLMGGAVPKKSIVVDLSKMDKITEFDPKKNTVRVEAGISVKELNEKLNAVGFEFPIYYSNLDISKIGSIIALNSPGNRSLRYGTAKDWTDEIEFVNGRGELMKNSKSDLMDFCGMEGITGIITKAKLRIKPLTKRSASVFQSEELEEVLSVARRLKLEKEVILLQLFPPEVSKLLGFPEKYNLIIEFDSERGKIRNQDYENLIDLKDRVFYYLYKDGYYDSEDPKLYFDRLRDLFSFLELNKVPYFSYLGSGNVHVFFKENDYKKQDVIKNIEKTRVKFASYGFGLKRKNFIDDFEKKVILRVKKRHDPFGKINKGKMIDFDSRVVEPGDDVPDSRTRERFFDKIKDIKPGNGEEKTASFVSEDLKKQESQAELSKEEVKDVEDFNKNIMSKKARINELIRNVVGEQKSGVSDNISEIPGKQSVRHPVKAVSESDSKEKSLIDSIMTNKYAKKSDDKKEVKEGDNKEKKQDSDESDIIKRIMTNKYRRDENAS
ncbi:FAD-binding protein [Candidatus Pacearchaeota archaeon]|nr:FAD-binding protein [Candidatus Pacearchaeota archaeon]MBD3283012.1 FAD-binding protein [Candidatus Pacearchaeota archaeon]